MSRYSPLAADRQQQCVTVCHLDLAPVGSARQHLARAYVQSINGCGIANDLLASRCGVYGEVPAADHDDVIGVEIDVDAGVAACPPSPAEQDQLQHQKNRRDNPTRSTVGCQRLVRGLRSRCRFSRRVSSETNRPWS